MLFRSLEMGALIAEEARAFEVNRNVLHRWRREFRDGPGNAFPGTGKRSWEENQVAQLDRKIGQQTLEMQFLKGCLQHIEEQRQVQAITGKPLSSSKSKKSTIRKSEPSLRLQALIGLSRCRTNMGANKFAQLEAHANLRLFRAIGHYRAKVASDWLTSLNHLHR